MLNEKPTIRKTEDDYLIVEGDLLLLSAVKKRIIKNEEEELIKNVLEKNRNDTVTCFYINKQSAYNNDFHLIDESLSPLGDIKVEIVTKNIDEVMNFFNL